MKTVKLVPPVAAHPSRADIPTRHWTVLAQDPSVLGKGGTALTTTVEVPAERLERGPKGHRIHVLDYDGSADRFYRSRVASPEKVSIRTSPLPAP